jgi:hypothetical protein
MQVGSEFAVSTVEQQFQIKALRTLNACLTALTVDTPGKFEGVWPCLLSLSHNMVAKEWGPDGSWTNKEYVIRHHHRYIDKATAQD